MEKKNSDQGLGEKRTGKILGLFSFSFSFVPNEKETQVKLKIISEGQKKKNGRRKQEVRSREGKLLTDTSHFRHLNTQATYVCRRHESKQKANCQEQTGKFGKTLNDLEQQSGGVSGGTPTIQGKKEVSRHTYEKISRRRTKQYN